MLKKYSCVRETHSFASPYADQSRSIRPHEAVIPAGELPVLPDKVPLDWVLQSLPGSRKTWYNKQYTGKIRWLSKTDAMDALTHRLYVDLEEAFAHFRRLGQVHVIERIIADVVRIQTPLVGERFAK
ncbi:MAG: hypothetical protein ABI702_00365 [Burkholderiales bacterium]